MKNKHLSTTFNLSNVKCASCVAKIENALTKLTVVKASSVNLLDKTLYVEYSSHKADALIASTLSTIGYIAETGQILETKPVNVWFSAGVPLLAGTIMMIGMLPQFMVHYSTNNGFLLGVLYSLVSLFIIIRFGHQIIIDGLKGFRTFNFNMYSLITLGVSSAWLYSVGVIVYHYYFNVHEMVHVYFESALIILGLVNLGYYLEDKAKANATNAIRELSNLIPTLAILVDDEGNERKVATQLITVDQMVRVRPGEQIPTDGVIIDGQGYLDESLLTGESLPTNKKNGDKVIAGSINVSGSFVFRVTATAGATFLDEMINLVKTAQTTKPHLAKLADKIAKVFVPTIMLIAVVSGLIWYFAAAENNLYYAVSVFMTVLIIACPCAVGLAIPVSLTVGLGRGAREGIIIRDARAISTVAKLDTIVLDKTGTITMGKPQVVAFEVDHNYDKDLVLQILKSLEHYSEHPLAHAIVAYLPQITSKGVVNDFKSLSGYGISGVVDGVEYFAGSANFMSKRKRNENNLLTNNNFSNIYLATRTDIIARVDISDPLKPDSAHAIKEFMKNGYDVVMLTGDNQISAEFIAKQVGIKDVIANCKPEDKINHIKKLQAYGKMVAFVGDGINDAPSLVQANVGIAIGGGTDVAKQSSSINLVGSSLLGVNKAFNLANTINLNMKQNLFGAFIYNLGAIVVATGALYPTFGWLLNPVVASLAMSMSSITVILNSLRLRKI